MQQRSEHDLVVLGSGIAGQTTATTAAEAGLDVLLVEKQPTLGGTSTMSGGWFAFSGTPEQAEEGIEDSADLFRRDLLEGGRHLNDLALVDAYLTHQQAAYGFLKGHQVRFREVAISSGMSAARGHNSEIRGVLATLHAAFVAAGGTTRTDTAAQRLLTDGGRVVGVRAQGPDGPVELYGRRGVVLATGGFSRGAEMLKIFAPEQLAAIPYGGRGNVGDGLRMAWRLGAGMADMSFVAATYGSHPDTGEEFHELLTAYYLGAIVVNTDGRRFVDESIDYKALGRAVLDQPDGLGVQVFDSRVRAQSHRGIPLKDMDTLQELGHLHQAGTLEEAARLAGVAPDALVATVERYNLAVAGRATDEQGRTGLCNGVGTLPPIDAPPYYAYPAKALMTTTYCGVTVTPDARVTTVDGEPIDGLYAVGEVVGGFHGATYITGTSLGKGVVFGHLLGTTLAGTAPQGRSGGEREETAA
ncbi:FAD-dependent oxidoreductase [Streptomyces sp. SID10853]|uniref:FAD-dependent oxidoreductase n=1 Tax=Streptomyces sp. SID10853 TaxID=2706028 RepID=UPI0013BEE447|nr:FAD-dependent oxidoreductase [Streptomyces sp. SID10853]NDZ80871.1 FAD-dependent oxidoreductase [Streptomyces sp. SID10853]